MHDNIGDLLDHTWVTLEGGALRASSSRSPSVSGSGSSSTSRRSLRRALYPLLIASQSIPTVVLAPVLRAGPRASASGRSSRSSRSSASSRSSSARSTGSQRRPRVHPHDADPRRDPDGDLPARRVPVGAAADLHRHARRRHLRRDRSGVRRVGRLRVRARLADAPGEGPPRHPLVFADIALRHGDGARALRLVSLVERLTIPWARRQEAPSTSGSGLARLCARRKGDRP